MAMSIVESERPTSIRLAVYSLWLRELVRFVRQKSRLFGAVATPLLFWLVIGGGFGKSFKPTGGLEGVTYLEYFFPGVVVLVVLFTTIYSTISVIDDRKEGFLQGVLVSPAPRGAVVMAKLLGGTTMAMLEAVLMLLIAPLVGMSMGVASVLLGLVFLFLIAFGLTGLGLMIAWAMESTAGFHAIMNLLLMPMWILSGAVFPVKEAHPILRVVMILNPLTYGVDGFREALYGSSNLAGRGLWPMWLCGLISALFAAATAWGSVRVAGRKAESGR
jgi:ABC-2 type transport system permease protein